MAVVNDHPVVKVDQLMVVLGMVMELVVVLVVRCRQY